jgi:hypothetical protein
MTAESFAISDHSSLENRLRDHLLAHLGRPQDQPLSSMSHSAADGVASADNSCEPHSNLHPQSQSTLHHEHHNLTTRHPSTAAQTLGNDGELATATPVLSASGLIVHSPLGLARSLTSHTMPSLPSEVSFVIGEPATQIGQSEEPTGDMSMAYCPSRSTNCSLRLIVPVSVGLGGWRRATTLWQIYPQHPAISRGKWSKYSRDGSRTAVSARDFEPRRFESGDSEVRRRPCPYRPRLPRAEGSPCSVAIL